MNKDFLIAEIKNGALSGCDTRPAVPVEPGLCLEIYLPDRVL
ncbi:MAG TPA: hypothetical protein VHO70_13165 [Chitinispirillaceae bacterium]|nr:hypothetical protein [Chitinispirillaceae bacterium]